MQNKLVPYLLLLVSLTSAVNVPIADNYVGVLVRDTYKCPTEGGSSPYLKIAGFSYGQLDAQPTDIPPRPSMATVSFIVTNPANWMQACSGGIVQLQNGEWLDDGISYFKCGTESAPDPTCRNCTHFQFGWGHGSWRLAVNQTSPCMSGTSEMSYRVSGSTVLDPECTTSPYAYTSCSAPDFTLPVDVYGSVVSELEYSE
ncbi:hypothetical protein F4677DRAFT_460747 [Hypoxylon crocopeplum]|nr:hypothetical protein F4677DRAFT_460747 [Hypoxylon crocopeplum]